MKVDDWSAGSSLGRADSPRRVRPGWTRELSPTRPSSAPLALRYGTVLAQTTTTFDPGQFGEDLGQAAGRAWLVFAMFVVVYWLPTLIAAIKGNNLGRVLVINLLVGWTIVGWGVALVIALKRRAPALPHQQHFQR